MKKTPGNGGFSLSEVLIAVAILAMGLVFIAGTFPVGIGLTTVAVERTTAAVVAEEAFAKIKLYGVGDPAVPDDGLNLSNLFPDVQTLFADALLPNTIDPIEFAYPSTGTTFERQYYWSALCRVTEQDPHLVQVTVFVSRKTAAGAEYLGGDWPVPVGVDIENAAGREFKIWDPDQITYINPNSTIVDNQTGQIYRVLDRYDDADPDSVADIVVLDRIRAGDPSGLGSVWVVPRPVGGGRYPCIGIYQRIIRF